MSGNPMRWNCSREGCFNTKKRPKIEVFAECFGRGINFGDLDMVVERNGHILFGEWKPPSGSIEIAQRILHERLAVLPRCTVLTIFGDAETMQVRSFSVRTAAGNEPMGRSLDDLKKWIAWWYACADRIEQPLYDVVVEARR